MESGRTGFAAFKAVYPSAFLLCPRDYRSEWKLPAVTQALRSQTEELLWKLLFHPQGFSAGISGSLVRSWSSGEERGQKPEQYAVLHQMQTTRSLCLAEISPQLRTAG